MSVRSLKTLVGLLALLGLVVAWRILTLGMADLWATNSPDRALFWRSDHPDALGLAAESRLNAHDNAGAKALALRGIQAYPLDGRNYRVLGLLADLRGDAPHASPFFQIAAQGSPRDLLTHQKLAEYALKSEDVDQALVQFDLILRLGGGTDLLPRMVRLAEFPIAEPAFLRVLAQQPRWRTQFLQLFASQARDSDAVDHLYRRLDSAPGQTLTADERTAWINRLISDRKWEQAYVAWVLSLPASRRGALGNIFDGDFLFQPSNAGFGWQMPAIAGAEMQTGATSGSEKLLSLQFDGTQITFQNVSQLMALSPGRYILRGKAQANALITGRGLQWVLSCAEGQQQQLGLSPLLVGTQAWQVFEVAFEVPANLCGGQWLRLQMGAPDRISGHAAYAALSIERASIERAPDSGQSDER